MNQFISPPLPIDRLQSTADAIERVARRVRDLAANEGHTVTASPDIWLFRSDRPLDYVRNYAPTMNISVAVSGRKTVRIGELSRANDPGHYLVLHAGTHYHATVDASPADPYVALKLQLSPDILARVLLELIDLDAVPAGSLDRPPPVFVGLTDETLAEPLWRMLASLDNPVERQILIPACQREVAFRLLRSDAASSLRASLGREHARVLQAMRFIENADAPVDVETMARTVAMSPSHFAHRFRETVGMAPVQYLKMLRLERARTQMLDGASVGLAAERTGYASTSHFSRDFRGQFGLSPAAYARRFRVNLATRD